MQVFVERTLKIWLHSDIIFNFTKLSKESQSSMEFAHRVSNEVRFLFIIIILLYNTI